MWRAKYRPTVADPTQGTVSDTVKPPKAAIVANYWHDCRQFSRSRISVTRATLPATTSSCAPKVRMMPSQWRMTSNMVKFCAAKSASSPQQHIGVELTSSSKDLWWISRKHPNDTFYPATGTAIQYPLIVWVKTGPTKLLPAT
jgi:hypothetical protein